MRRMKMPKRAKTLILVAGTFLAWSVPARAAGMEALNQLKDQAGPDAAAPAPAPPGAASVRSSVPYEPPPFKPTAALAKLIHPSDEFTVILFPDPNLDKNPWFNPYRDWKPVLKDYRVRVQVVRPKSVAEAESYGLTSYPTVLFYRGTELVKEVQRIFGTVNGRNVFINNVEGFLVPALAEIGAPKTFWAQRRERREQERARRKRKEECEESKFYALKDLDSPLMGIAIEIHPELLQEVAKDRREWEELDCDKQ